VQITILGHASVLVEAGDQRVLVDPLFSDRFANGAIGFHPARTIHRDRMPEPTAIVVTHLHLDHWHPATLEMFDRATPVIAPRDEWVLRRLREIGFVNVISARAWTPIDLGNDGPTGKLELLPTPSDADVEEFGLVFRFGSATYWHMSDSDVTRAVGEQVRDLIGRPTVVATRYQPITPLISLQRGLGLSHDERDGVVAWLEAASVTDPTFLFPYFCDIDYLDQHAWANRYARPFAPAEIADLLRARLAAPAGRVDTVAPGDELVVASSGTVEHRRATSPFVHPTSGPGAAATAFEPIDDSTLFGVAAADRDELRMRFAWWMDHEFESWLAARLADPDSPAGNLVVLQVRWQVVVHLGDAERMAFHIHFTDQVPSVRPGTTPYPNYAIHIGGQALLDVLRGDGGNELFWLAAAARVYEKVLLVVDDRIMAPPLRGWDLFEAVPEPLSWCLRKHGAGSAVTAFDPVSPAPPISERR